MAGGSVCFIATDPDVARLLKVCLGNSPKNVGLVTRWFPGTLTNWSSIFGFVARAKENPELVSFRKSPKNFRRWQSLQGLQNLNSCPDVLVLLHAKDHMVAIQEASQMKIPSIGIVDSNANGSSLSYPIYANDDSLEAQFLYMRIFAEALKKAKSSTRLESSKSNPVMYKSLLQDVFGKSLPKFLLLRVLSR